MKTWKIISGILSIAISAFVVFQSFFAGAYNILTGNGQSSGTAGVVVAITLLAGGIVSLVTHNGSRGGDIAMALLYCVGGIVGIVMAGSYGDLRVWSAWGLLCGLIAIVDVTRMERGEKKVAAMPRPTATRSGPATFQEVILEPDPIRRNAAIDALPERQAKSYLKQALNVLVPRQLRGEDEDEESGLIKVLLGFLAVIGVGVIAIIAVGIAMGPGKDRSAVGSTPPKASQRVQESAPAQETPGQNQPVIHNDRYSVGESATNNGVTVTLVSVTESQGNNFFTPAEGKTFVLCEFEIENNSEKDITVSSMLSFSAYVDNYSTEMSFSAISSSEKQQLDGAIAAGRKMNGVIGYEVDAGWSEIEVRFSDNVWFGEETVFAYNHAI